MLKLANQFIRDEDGATALEYGLLAALIAAAITVAVGALGTSVTNTFDFIAGNMNEAVGGLGDAGGGAGGGAGGDAGGGV